MLALSEHQILTIATWFLLAVLIGFLILIGRAYQHIFGIRTYYGWFLAPLMLSGAASARAAFLDDVSGDLFADVMWTGAGLLLALLCWSLYNSMLGERTQRATQEQPTERKRR